MCLGQRFAGASCNERVPRVGWEAIVAGAWQVSVSSVMGCVGGEIFCIAPVVQGPALRRRCSEHWCVGASVALASVTLAVHAND